MRSTLKRKVLDFKQKQKIIEEYDNLVKVQGKVNKAKFAKSHGLPKSSLGTILASKNRRASKSSDNL